MVKKKWDQFLESVSRRIVRQFIKQWKMCVDSGRSKNGIGPYFVGKCWNQTFQKESIYGMVLSALTLLLMVGNVAQTLMIYRVKLLILTGCLASGVGAGYAGRSLIGL